MPSVSDSDCQPWPGTNVPPTRLPFVVPSDSGSLSSAGSSVTNDADGENGPTAPPDSARTFHVCSALGASVAATRYVVPLTSAFSTSVPASLNTWKRYCSATGVVLWNCSAAALAVRSITDDVIF